MALFCAISNEVPELPVISPLSGCIYDRRLIEKYISENGTDPINGEKLSAEMLIDVKTTPLAKPRPPSATSIPAILKSLQDEWDAVMLHSFTLRQQLQTARQELSHALYQHDAACRVIARLTKEVTAAREALATLKPQAAVNVAATPTHAAAPAAAAVAAAPEMPPDGPQKEIGMTEDILQKLQETAATLTSLRKQRGKKVPEELVGSDLVRNYRTQSSHVGLHSASVPGILCMDIQQIDSNKILTGGNDKNAVVFNKETEQVVALLKGHSKRVTDAIFHPTEEFVFTSSPDTTVRTWHVTTAQSLQIVRAHEGAVTGLSLHPTGDYLLSCSSDAHWAFSDIKTGNVVVKVGDTSGAGLTCAQFHPDGLIFGTGTGDSDIRIWDLKDRTKVANFPGHSGPISSLAFSENGYYLATSADDSSVKLWDLRKLKNFKTIDLDNGYEVKNLSFDQSGTYLAVAGSDVRVYLVKQWECLCAFNDHTAMATAAKFGKHASFLASASMDRSLKFFSI